MTSVYLGLDLGKKIVFFFVFLTVKKKKKQAASKKKAGGDAKHVLFFTYKSLIDFSLSKL